MSEYSHRDLRAERDADRAFWTVVALCVGWTVFAVEVPLPFAGVVAVVALLALGAGYLVWSERMLASYAGDLARAGEATTPKEFRSAEAASRLPSPGSSVQRPTQSPHRSRRSSPEGARESASEPAARSGRQDPP